MSILDRFRKKPEVASRDKNTAMSGQRMEMPNESNLPIVNNYSNDKGMIKLGYGSDMSLPLIIEQSYYMSPSHKNCIKLKVSMSVGAGYDFERYDATDLKQKMQIDQFENVMFLGGLKAFIKNITKDYALHNRRCIKVTKKGGFIQFERMNPSTIGYNQDLTKFYHSKNFELGKVEKEYDRFQGQKEGVFMMEYDGDIDKYDPYAVPEWLSIMPNVKLNAMIPQFHEANMENSVGINLIFRKPTEFENGDEKRAYRQGIERERGVKGTGNFLVLSGNGMENVTEAQQLMPNQNDKLFAELRSSSIDDICMGHNANPILIGQKTPGSLGAGKESEVALNIFHTVEVIPLIEDTEYMVNDLLKMVGFPYRFKLKDNKVNFQAAPESVQQFELKAKK